jgi:hypothetical protein
VTYPVSADGNGIIGHDVTSQNMRDTWTNQRDLGDADDCRVTPGLLPEELTGGNGAD